MGGIFKAYDIRGIYPTELDEDLAYRIGRSFVLYTKAREVLVGGDSRLSTPVLKQAVIDGITDQGANVIDIGLATTPMTNFLHAHYKFDASVQVTASHNPKEYGGFKLNTKGAEPLTGDKGIPELQALAEKDEFPNAIKGTVLKRDYLEVYADLIADLVQTDLSDLHVVIDASNGPVGMVCEKVFDKLGLQYVEMNFEPDGNFPAHDPNPLKGDAQEQARQKVLEVGADLGCLFDADADRVVFVDEEGNAISPDLIAAALAGFLLKQNKGGKVVYDCFSSHAIKDAIAQAGGIGIVMRTGRSFIYQRARQEDVVFGAEASSHYYHRAVYHGDHGVYTLLKVMEMITAEQQPLSAIVKRFDTYANSGQINITVDGDPQAAIEKVAEAFKDGEQSRMDGIIVEYPDGSWFIVRPSNTEPLIRLRVESKDPERVAELTENVKEAVGGR